MVKALPPDLYRNEGGRPPLRLAHWSDGSVVYGDQLVVRPDMVDPDGIKLLEALVDGKVVASCDTIPFYLAWKDVKPGAYVVGIRATLRDGTVIEAKPATIEVRPRSAT